MWERAKLAPTGATGHTGLNQQPREVLVAVGLAVNQPVPWVGWRISQRTLRSVTPVLPARAIPTCSLLYAQNRGRHVTRKQHRVRALIRSRRRGVAAARNLAISEHRTRDAAERKC